MRIHVILLGMACCIATQLSSAQTNATTLAKTLSLEQAYDRALATDQSIRIAFEELRKANLDPWAALTRMGPRLTAEAALTHPERNIYSGTTNKSPMRVDTKAATVTAEQPLIDLAVFPSSKRGNLSEESATLAHRFTVRNILFGVSRSYHAVLTLERVLEVERETPALAEQQFTLADDPRLGGGSAAHADVEPVPGGDGDFPVPAQSLRHDHPEPGACR
jgi:outer membrane protein TolC